MSKYGYVIIYNASPIPVRHIIAINEEYNESDFKKWYYGLFHRLNGDTFVHTYNIVETLERLGF